MVDEILMVVLIGLIVLGGPLLTFVLAVIAYTRSSRINELIQRTERLEQQLRQQAAASPVSAQGIPSVATTSSIAAARPVSTTDLPPATDPAFGPIVPPAAAPVAAAVPQPQWDPFPGTPLPAAKPRPTATAGRPAVDGVASSQAWEVFLGQKAFGWMAVLLFSISAAMFLRYAFQGNWIGPLGRVIIGQLAGLALVAAGTVYHRRGLKQFSGMLTAAGFAALYLTTYGAYALYQLLPSSHLAVFLTVIVVLSMVAAALYRSLPVAVATVLGGFATPLLLATDTDTYQSFFTYLAVLNTVVVATSLLRRWPIIVSLAFAATQTLFWLWYEGNYHPEKLDWAIGFQVVVFFLYWLHSVVRAKSATQLPREEELVRFLLNALAGFSALYFLVLSKHWQWQGVGAIAMSVVYAATAYYLLRPRRGDVALLLTSLALSLGFLSWALPLQAQSGWSGLTHWVAAGWAIMGLMLYRFGLRIDVMALRCMAAGLGVAAFSRWLLLDLPMFIREPFWPLLNEYGFPATIIALSILAAVISAYRYWQRLSKEETVLLAGAGIVGVVMLGVAWSVDFYGYFVSQSLIDGELHVWRWRGQLALTFWWTIYATTLMVAGFRLDRARLRWLAMLLYGITVCKLFLVDLATVQQLYRMIGFFILSVVLALVARAYQRFK